MKARWIPLLLMIALDQAGWGQSQPQPRFAITAPQIARALSERGVQTEGEQVSLLASVVATDPNPALDVLSLETLASPQPSAHSQIRSRVKLGCRMADQCLPFYAVVTWPQGTAWAATITSSSSPVLKNHVVGSPSGRNGSSKPEVTMPAGAHALLVMDDQRSRIQVAVVSLENGAAGQKIRVSSLDHKQFYMGEVVSPTLLKGSF